MRYQKVVEGEFVSRPNRFIAHVIVDGVETVAHVKNTGRCKELLIPGRKVYLEDFEGRMGTRKYQYSLIGVDKDGLMINMDSQAPNVVVKEALEAGTISFPELGELITIRPETVFGDSRFDFYLKGTKGEGFLEVKGCTLEDQRIASFPDAPTERGVKHIKELEKAKEEGYFAGILFAIQMAGMRWMVPNDTTHPEFGAELRKARAAGVEVVAYACDVGKDCLRVTTPVEVRL